MLIREWIRKGKAETSTLSASPAAPTPHPPSSREGQVRQDAVLLECRSQGQHQAQRCQPGDSRRPSRIHKSSHHRLWRRVSDRDSAIRSCPWSTTVANLRLSPRTARHRSVTHPGPGSLLPSIASVVASHDPHGLEYTTEVRAQNSREEIVSAAACEVSRGTDLADPSSTDPCLPDHRPRRHG